jgi:hypothetical protein
MALSVVVRIDRDLRSDFDSAFEACERLLRRIASFDTPRLEQMDLCTQLVSAAAELKMTQGQRYLFANIADKITD